MHFSVHDNSSVNKTVLRGFDFVVRQVQTDWGLSPNIVFHLKNKKIKSYNVVPFSTMMKKSRLENL